MLVDARGREGPNEILYNMLLLLLYCYYVCVHGNCNALVKGRNIRYGTRLCGKTDATKKKSTSAGSRR